MVVLDTCALLWLANGDPLSTKALARIEAAAHEGNLILPAIAVWEIGTLIAKNRVVIQGDFRLWLDRLLARDGLRIEPLTRAVAQDAATLPGSAPRDPGDRFVIATARLLDAPLATRDRAILRYGAVGHVRVLPC